MQALVRCYCERRSSCLARYVLGKLAALRPLLQHSRPRIKTMFTRHQWQGFRGAQTESA